MNWKITHIVNLIWFNPITCVHYYNHQIKCFQKLCIKNDTIFGPLLDCFFVTKFWNCGSGHNNGLLWVANAPTYGLEFNKIIENFVDKYITCDR
jgi:hypothetical protein